MGHDHSHLPTDRPPNPAEASDHGREHQHSGKHHDHDHDHGHSHGHHAPADYSRAFAIGLVLNLGFVGVEAFYGWTAHSVALLADAGHNLSDVLGLVVSWVALILSRRQPCSRYTYGWRRSSILAAFLNALFLMLVTGGLAWETVQRFHQTAPIQGGTMIVVAIVGIIINTATALLFVSGQKTDINLRSAFLHMAADALVSLGVVIAGIGILLTHWDWLDPAFSLVISAVIAWNTWEILQEALSLAVDGVPPKVDERAVRLYLTEYGGVTQVHDLHIWAMSTTETALTAHLVMPAGHPGDACLAHIAQELQAHFAIDHTTLQIELGDSEQPCRLVSDAVV